MRLARKASQADSSSCLKTWSQVQPKRTCSISSLCTWSITAAVFGISRLPRRLGVLLRVVEVGVLEGQRHGAEEVAGANGCPATLLPEVAVDREVAEARAVVFEPREVHARVPLLVLEDVGRARGGSRAARPERPGAPRRTAPRPGARGWRARGGCAAAAPGRASPRSAARRSSWRTGAPAAGPAPPPGPPARAPRPSAPRAAAPA